MKILRKKLNRKGGFSLVEISMALGLVSFVLVSVLGLMAVGFRSSKEAFDDTMVAGLIPQAVERSRRTGGDVFTFTREGVLTTNSADVHYTCRVADSQGGAGAGWDFTIPSYVFTVTWIGNTNTNNAPTFITSF